MKARQFVALWAFVVIAAVSGCGSSSEAPPESSAEATASEAEPQPEPQPEATADATAEADAGDGSAVRYLSLGDSLTQGVGAPDESTGSFPALLAQHWRDAGCEVELNNVGLSGYTTAQILDEQVPAIADFSPTFITFQGGGNDLVYGVTPDEYRTNVSAILDAATGSGAQVAVFAQNEWFRAPSGEGYTTPEQRDELDQILIEEAGSRGVEFVDLRPLYTQQADENLWVEDGIHPTPEAYQAWADEMAGAIPAPCQ